MVQKNIMLVCLIFLVVVLLMSSFSSAASKSNLDYAGKTFYLQSNLWNEWPKDILSTNYHRGGVIPVGAGVTISEVKKKVISFSVDETGVKYNLVLVKKHSVLDIHKLFNRYFGEVSPKEGELYKSLSKHDRGYIETGTICSGMTKEAVVLSYGYPPTHRTPSLKANEWNYWESRMRRIAVSFRDDKVVGVRGYKFFCGE